MNDKYHDPNHPLMFVELPYQVYFRIDDFAVDSRFSTHAHKWGQLNYCVTGVMELNIAGTRYLSPPQYGIWIPPNTPHDAHIRQKVIYHSAYIDAALCAGMPSHPCALVLSPLLKALLADLAERGVMTPSAPADKRLAQVLIDQLELAPCTRSYLPGSEDPILAVLLDALQQDLGSNRSLAEWAQRLHVTERTLARRCLRDLGMSFSEWRQRQRFLAALPLLEQGQTVQNVAFDLGYGTSSAFIAMFRRQSGSTPDQLRRGLLKFSQAD
jgi:AraC-like DNA-binding protein